MEEKQLHIENLYDISHTYVNWCLIYTWCIECINWNRDSNKCIFILSENANCMWLCEWYRYGSYSYLFFNFIKNNRPKTNLKTGLSILVLFHLKFKEKCFVFFLRIWTVQSVKHIFTSVSITFMRLMHKHIILYTNISYINIWLRTHVYTTRM